MRFAAERRVYRGETLSAPKVDSILQVQWTTIKIYVGLADMILTSPSYSKTICSPMTIE